MTPEEFKIVHAFATRLSDDNYPEGALVLKLCEYAKQLENAAVARVGPRSFERTP